MKNYRIKTEQEFINEFGLNWKNKVGISFTKSMDFMLGQPLELYINVNNINFNSSAIVLDNAWTITKNMVTEIITVNPVDDLFDFIENLNN